MRENDASLLLDPIRSDWSVKTICLQAPYGRYSQGMEWVITLLNYLEPISCHCDNNFRFLIYFSTSINVHWLVLSCEYWLFTRYQSILVNKEGVAYSLFALALLSIVICSMETQLCFNLSNDRGVFPRHPRRAICAFWLLWEIELREQTSQTHPVNFEAVPEARARQIQDWSSVMSIGGVGRHTGEYIVHAPYTTYGNNAEFLHALL